MVFLKGFCHGSYRANISYEAAILSANKGAMTLSLLFCTLY